MADIPDRISPLHELAMPVFPDEERAQVELSERLCDSLVQVQAWPKTLPQLKKIVASVTRVKPQTGDKSASNKAVMIMPTGPGRYMIEDDSDDLETRLRNAIDANTGAVTGMSHSRVVVSVKGEKAEWVLASGIAIDFSLTAFPVGAVRLTHHHEIGLTIVRTDADCFDLYVFTSFARSFWTWLVRAASEVGYRIS